MANPPVIATNITPNPPATAANITPILIKEDSYTIHHSESLLCPHHAVVNRK